MSPPNQPIAIVGSSCRFPGGASSPSKLWNLLSQPRDVLRSIPSDRFNPQGFYHPNGQRAGTTNVQHAYTLEEDFRHFDASFFSIKPLEADSMDPQQRLLLETVYESLESAGIPMENLRGSNTAVYVGLMCMDYGETGMRDLDSLPTYFATGASRCIISNRISYFFDWHGPSMTIDTACSSSLVAMHQAVQTLRSGQSRVAVAGGANVILGPEAFISESNLKMLSPEGRSRMWDSKANGYARGEGVAAIVLKTFQAALEDGDHIECIIRETGVNSDGRTNGITMPSSDAQRDLIRDTYFRAGLDIHNPAHRPQYFEAHGTGTPAGDPIEARAIHDAFFDQHVSLDGGGCEKGPLFIGSIKTVVGHTEGTAGLAGVLKATLALKHSVIPPNMLFSNLNPDIKPFYQNLRIVSSAQPWPQLPRDSVRRASVNSFGFGGTNAHAILEAYHHPAPGPEAPDKHPELYSPFIFSAASEDSLVVTLRNYAAYLRMHPQLHLRSLLYTLQTRRSTLPARTHFCASSAPELAERMEEAVRRAEAQEIAIRPSSEKAAESGILGVFTGQGAQWATMGRELIRGSHLVRHRLRQLEESLATVSPCVRPDWSLTAELLKDATESRIAEARLSQPLCTAIQIVLVDLLRAAGIQFKSVIGHSSGEIAAAYAAGFVSAEDAVRIAHFRGTTASLACGAEGQRGAMMAVGTSHADALELCSLPSFAGRLCVAAVNSSSSVTLSGDADAVAEAQLVFAEEKKFNRVLKVDTAYHSHHMQQGATRYLELMRAHGVQAVHATAQEGEGRPTWYSSVRDGAVMGAGDVDALAGEYWKDNMRLTVNFHHALSAALSAGGAHHVAMEVGPHPALQGPCQQTIASDSDNDNVLYVGTLERSQHDAHALSHALARIWEASGPSAVNLSAFDAALASPSTTATSRSALSLIKDLPTYAWRHDRLFWHEGRASRAFRTRSEPVHELLGIPSPDGFQNIATWHNVLRPDDIPWLAGHELQKQVIFPASGYIGMAIEAALLTVAQPDDARLITLDDIQIARPLTFDHPAHGREVRFHLCGLASDARSTTFSWSLHSHSTPDSSSLALNASGRVRVFLAISSPAASLLPAPDPEDGSLIACSSERFYRALRGMGYGYNGAFAGIKHVKRRLGKASGVLDASTDDHRHSTRLRLHPAVLDLAFQATFLAYAAPGDGRLWSLHIPTSIRSISVDLAALSYPHSSPLTDFRFVANVRDPYDAAIEGNVDVHNASSTRTLLQVQGVRVVPLSAAAARDDCRMFADLRWDIAYPEGESAVAETPTSDPAINATVIEPSDAETSAGVNWLGAMVRQLSHRYSRLKVLELAAESDLLAQHVLERLGTAFASYTHTSMSSDVLEQSSATLQSPNDSSIVTVKRLDWKGDLAEQGFASGSYDLIICANLIAQSSGTDDDALRAARSLLRPGAYLVALETAPVRLDDHILTQNGFSGVETVASKPGYSCEVIVSQAQTPETELYRSPLDVNGLPAKMERLLIVGGHTPPIRTLVRGIQIMLARHAHSIEVYQNLDDVGMIGGGAGHATVLLLADLDEPIFQNCSDQKLEGLKQIIFGARDIVWVTSGCRSSNPYANLSHGFGRTVAMESSHLRLHLVDIDHRTKPDVVEVTEMLLRWHLAGLWERNSTNNDFLLSIEPEIAIENGHVYIPRVYPNTERNDRYNSTRRKITAKVRCSEQPVRIKQSSDSSYRLEVQPRFTQHSHTNDKVMMTIALAVSISTLSALKLTDGVAFYLVAGRCVATDRNYMGFSTSLSSLITLPQDRVVEVYNSVSEDMFAAVAANITAETIMGLIPQDTPVVLHDAAHSLISAIQELAPRKNAHFICTASTATASHDVVRIHPQSTGSKIRSVLPRGPIWLFNFAETEIGRETAHLLIASLDAPVTIVPGPSLLLSEASCGQSFEHDHTILHNALDRAQQQQQHASKASHANTVQVGNVSDIRPGEAYSSIVRWTMANEVTASVAPLDESPIFATSKTYILFGLTGGLGLSLCEWMVRKGARYLVLTSRSPRVDAEWLARLKAAGATVKVIANDITNKQAVLELRDLVIRTMPPIAGVANGAMVLRDTVLYEMNAQGLNQVLRPKVDGTVILDEIFRDKSLDFFILFSSITCVFGNSGQASYTAANMFLTSLAAQRRANGLVASVMDIGAMIGTGYMDRELSPTRRDELLSLGYLGMSERDFHHTFAEAVVAGLSGNAGSPEIIAGLRCVSPAEAALTRWYDHAKYQHCIIWTNDGDATEETRSKANVSARKRLLEATSIGETRDIITDAFATKLQVMLQLRSDGISDRSLMLRSGLTDLGVDSLVAVDIRSWFLKELDVDIPVLQILGGVSVEALIEMACVALPPGLTGRVSSSETVASDSNTSLTTDDGLASPSPEDTDSSSDLTSLDRDGEMTPLSKFSESDVTRDMSENLMKDVRPSVLRTAPLSWNQARFWFLRSYIEDQTTFNVTCRICVEGSLQVRNLEMAVAALGQRHEALRTSFFTDDDGNAYQAVLEKAILQLEKKGHSSDEDSAREHEALAKHVYNLEEGELMRILLLSVTPNLHYILIGYHHINMDGVSFQILLDDLESFYKFQHPTQEILQYPDHAYRQRSALETHSYDKDVDFWREEFQTLPTPLPLFPFAEVAVRPHLQAYSSNKFDLRLEPALAARVKRTSAAASSASAFHFYLTVLRVLIAKFLHVEDFCIGIADANRIEEDTRAAVGMYLNLLPLRFSNHSSRQPFAKAVMESRAKAFAAFSHSTAPFDVVLEKLSIPRSASRSPLFQAFLDFRHGQQETRSFGNCEMKGDMFEMGQTAYDLSVDIMENQGGDTLITFALQKQLYSAESVAIVAKSFLHLVQQFSDNADLLLGESDLFSPMEISRAIDVGRGSPLEQTWPATMAHRIEEVAAQFPNRQALEDGDGRTFTYAEMSEKVQDLTNALIIAGVKLSDSVAMYQQPSADWVCTMLAIFRVGAIYVPLDMRAPAKRHRVILEGVRPAAIVHHKETSEDSVLLGFEEIPRIDASTVPKATTHHPIAASRKDDAVILHTSGSTGEPKGIILTHEGLCNTLEFSSRGWDIGIEVVLQQTAFSFDASLDEVSIALCNGGWLFIVPKHQRMDSAAVVEEIHKRGITYTMATPSEYRSWMSNGDENLLRDAAWRIAYVIGEKLTPGFMQSFQAFGKPDLRLYNGYGPAECTILTSKCALTYTDAAANSAWESSAIPCGRVLPNFSAYIMSEQMQPLPVGMPGELFIGGAGVGRGYLNLPELTAAKFLDDPYASERAIEKGWTRMHRSGDKAKLLHDGTVVVLGRMDDSTQVKVRGIRTDLRDIESAIVRESNGSLHDAIVSYRADEDLLIGHVVFSRTSSELNKYRSLESLRNSLPFPQYMMPSAIIPLDEFPLNPHGKPDRRAIGALPLDLSFLSSEKRKQELSGLEASLWNLWKQLLPRELVDTVVVNSDTDFFQLGGNSLLLVALRNKIRDFYDTTFRLNELMEYTTIGSMGALIQKSSRDIIIDWAAEIALPESLQRTSRRKPPANSKTVLLTGATGFIGRHMVEQLINDPTIGTIHVVAVRSLAERSKSHKVKEHIGDLSRPFLGLDETTFYELADHTDAIVHVGAWRSFWENYQLLQKSNVQSTKELIRMAAVRNVPLHFMSSGVVSLFDDAGSQPPLDGSEGYVASKWASEKVLQRAASTLNLPVVIHRLDTCTPGNNNTINDPAILREFSNMAKTIKSIPDIGGWYGTFDLLPVDDLTSKIVQTVLEKPQPGDGDGDGNGGGDPASARIIRYPGIHRVDARSVAEYVVSENQVKEDGEGEEWVNQPAIYWVGEIKKHGFPYVISAQDLMLRDDGGSAVKGRDVSTLALRW